MAKAKKGDVEAHLQDYSHFKLMNDAFSPEVNPGKAGAIAAHNLAHQQEGELGHPGHGHTHERYGRTTLSPSIPKEGYSQGAMANQELGKDRRQDDHPANAERNAELARRVTGKSGKSYSVTTPPEPSTEWSDQERRY